MISYWIRKDGNGSVLEPREVPVPEMNPGQMLVRMKASSFNRGDIMGISRRHNFDEPRQVGVDGAGEVVDPGTTSFRNGDKVFFRGHGCFAEYAAVDGGLAALLPDRLTYEQGAAILGVFVTAWEALVQYGQVARNDRVLICGGSSGVGVAALQLARHLGAEVIVTSGSAGKLARLKDLGADAGVRARGSAFVDEVMRITEGKGVNAVLNMVGGTAFPGAVAVAAPFARIVMVGYVDGQQRSDIDLEAVHSRRLVISGISNTHLKPEQRVLAMEGMMRDLYPAFVSGEISPVIDRIFPFGALPEAKDYVESDQMVGKVVVSIP